jgi:predicted NUDIX family NTP pyrophosphohydrolase
MPAHSAGILMYRRGRGGALEVLLAHPGGPFWRRRDAGAWSIPKGEVGPLESPETTALREFREEIGIEPQGRLESLGTIRQKAGKYVDAFALEGDFAPDQLSSNTFELEWPPKSGRRAKFPEVDRVEWFDLDSARDKMLAGQVEFLDMLEERYAASDPATEVS